MIMPDPNPTVALALAEDVGSGDLTAALIPGDAQAEATVISRETAILCGAAWFDAVFRQLDPSVQIVWRAADGERVEPNQLLCTLNGPARALLTGERTALNFLQALSGTATLARQFADLVAGTGATILDTRKTLPGLRLAQKYAVRCGGCQNHRIGLFDAVLIKENHIMAAGSITNAIATARRLHPGVTVEVEVENLTQLEEALAAQPDIVMLDNFDLATMAEAVKLTQRRVKLEASGNVNFDTVHKIAATGVDYISIGGLTKDVRAVDLSMRFRTL
ncbi:MAG: carboxylating nicotinate-nucleotide diphosphorylase [Candidatus Competibacteraceae bacterium]